MLPSDRSLDLTGRLRFRRSQTPRSGAREPSGSSPPRWLCSISRAETVYAGAPLAVDLPFAVATQCAGIAHFVVGFLFLATSTGLRNPRGRLRIALALAIGAGLCWLYAWGGGRDAYPRLPQLFVFVYFLVHSLRDEGFFYCQHREAPKLSGKRRSYVAVALVGVIFGLVALLWSYAFIRPGETKDLSWLIDPRRLEGGAFTLGWLGPTVVLLGACGSCLGWASRRIGLTLRGLFALDRPLWTVYAGVLAVVLGATAFGGSGHSIVLLHVTSWWIFASVGLARFGKHGGPRTLGLLGWVRHTQSGFQTLHVGLLLAVLAAVLVWTYGPKDAGGTLAWVAHPDSFYYWTILHITVSFVPKG